MLLVLAASACAGKTGTDPSGAGGADAGDAAPMCQRWRHIDIGGGDTRRAHAAAWTGSELFVWGGISYTQGWLNSGWRVDIDAKTVQTTPLVGAPSARFQHHAFWTGNEVMVLGGKSASGYEPDALGWDPDTEDWFPMTSSEHFGRVGGATVSAGDGRVFLIAGFNGNDFGDTFWNDGWEFTPLTFLAPIDVPLPRNWVNMASGWTGSEVLLWGGRAGEGILDDVNVGFRYEPLDRKWRQMSSTGAPSARQSHTLTISGDSVLIWGGASVEASAANDGAIYSLATDSWRPITTEGAPAGRFFHTATVINGKMVIFGGSGLGLQRPDGSYDIGGVYDIKTDSWAPLPTGPCSPPPLTEHTATAAGNWLVIWGGATKEQPDLPESGWMIEIE